MLPSRSVDQPDGFGRLPAMVRRLFLMSPRVLCVAALRFAAEVMGAFVSVVAFVSRVAVGECA
jgi:hypothetical protein